MNAKKSTTNGGDQDRKTIKPEPITEEDGQLEEDLWEDEDFGGLQAPEDFKRQLGCGG